MNRRERAEEVRYVHDIIEEILRECPERRPTSADERRSQEIMEREWKARGLATEVHPFRFNESLYANLALHFGLGTAGTMVSGVAPLVGLALHSLVAGSYWADSTRRGYILRRAFPFKESQNLLATMPAKEPVKLRIVFAAHADAAFTGFLFHPWLVEHFSKEPPPGLGFLRRSLALATRTQAGLAGFDLLRVLLGPLTWPLRPVEAVLTIPSLIAFLLNLEIVLRDQVVPGANDNLSGVAALPLIAERLAESQRPDVEYVFVITGCEEASLGGGDALARRMEGVWDKSRTVILGLDSLSNGALHFLDIEGEVVRTSIPAWIREVMLEVAASEERFSEVEGFEVPVGGSDVAAFLAHGWDGACLTCIDKSIGAPEHYHRMTDNLENLDVEKVVYSVDFLEKVTNAILERRLG